MATEVISIIDPDAGSGYDYDSLYDWEAGEQGDLTGARDEIAVATCRCTGGTADTTIFTIAGWTTSATQYIKIWTDPAESYGPVDGKWTTGNHYRLEATGGNVIDTDSSGVVRIDILNLQVECNRGTNSGRYALKLNGLNSTHYISGCVIKATYTGAGSASGITLVGTGETFKIKNTVIYASSGTGSGRGIYNEGSGSEAYIYNCTIYGFSAGIVANTTYYVKNSAIFGNADDFNGLTSGNIDNCASDDGDGDSPVDISPGATEADDWAACFTDYANGDFSLKPASVCIGAALNLYNDASYPFQDDIIGTDRGGSGASWDIGAFEYVAAVPVIMRSYRARRN